LEFLIKRKNCKCDNNIEAKFYCIPCKISCCTKYTLEEHKLHLLVAKGDLDMQPKQIQKSFQTLEDFMEKDELIFKNFINIKHIYNIFKIFIKVKEVENTYNKLLKMINDLKNYKINEINELFEELVDYIKNVNDKKKKQKIH
jgi:hypothetical protein